MYKVHSIFKTVQGEGANLGRQAVFVRFSGCNLWSGHEADRARAACQFCDTDFVAGADVTEGELVERVLEKQCSFCVLTGGEPLLQVDHELLAALFAAGLDVAIETNGTVSPPSGFPLWLCVSPKGGTSLKVSWASELKVAWPQEGLDPAALQDRLGTELNWLSPIDGYNYERNVEACLAYIEAHPAWRLAVQAHKKWGVA